jgi:hypothetical protein
MSRLSSNLIESQALQNAALYTQAIKEARTLYNSEAVDRLKSAPGIIITHDYTTKEGAIPIPATYLIKLGSTLSEKILDVNRVIVTILSRARMEGGPRDNVEREALRNCGLNPQQAFFRCETFQWSLSLRYAAADILKPSCVLVITPYPDSPKK